MDELFEKRKKIIYEFICDEFYVPMKLKELSMLLQVPKDQKGELKAVMDSLEKEGRVHVTQKGKYIKGEAKQLRGMFQANARGFGFVTVEGESEDIFISEDDMNGAMQGDEVEVVITKAPEGKRREGKITKIVQRGIQRIVGYYQSRKNFGFVVPDNERFLQDIFVPAERSKGAVTGHKVVVELTSYGENGKKPEGKIVEILGHVTDPGVDILSIVKGYDLPTEFPEKVLNQAERVAKAVTTADMAGRKDVRSWQTVTIGDGDRPATVEARLIPDGTLNGYVSADADALGTPAGAWQRPHPTLRLRSVTLRGPGIERVLRPTGSDRGDDLLAAYAAGEDRLDGPGFLFVGLPAGAYELTLDAPGYRPHVARHVVVPGAVTSMTPIRLVPEPREP